MIENTDLVLFATNDFFIIIFIVDLQIRVKCVSECC